MLLHFFYFTLWLHLAENLTHHIFFKRLTSSYISAKAPRCWQSNFTAKNDTEHVKMPAPCRRTSFHMQSRVSPLCYVKSKVQLRVEKLQWGSSKKKSDWKKGIKRVETLWTLSAMCVFVIIELIQLYSDKLLSPPESSLLTATSPTMTLHLFTASPTQQENTALM